MRFEVELTLTEKRFRYAITFEYPPKFHEARILDSMRNCRLTGMWFFHGNETKSPCQTARLFFSTGTWVRCPLLMKDPEKVPFSK